MSDCKTCIHFIEEHDTNYQDCFKHESNDNWFSTKKCPSYIQKEDSY